MENDNILACDDVQSWLYQWKFHTTRAQELDDLDPRLQLSVWEVLRKFCPIRNGDINPSITTVDLANILEMGGIVAANQDLCCPRQLGQSGRAELPKSIGKPYYHRQTTHSYNQPHPANHSRNQDMFKTKSNIPHFDGNLLVDY